MSGEARLWQRMRAGITPHCFAQRVENLVGSGMPDVILHSRDNGSCAMIELKCRLLMPVRSNTPIFTGSYGLRPEQVSWIYARAIVGASIWVLAQGGGAVWLVHGRYARDLCSMTAADLDLAADWSGMARGTDWEGLLDIVF